MVKDRMVKKLLNKSAKEYGENYRSHYFEQYKMYIESAEKISDRRQNANNFFLTINTVLISVFGLSFQIKILEDLGWGKGTLGTSWFDYLHNFLVLAEVLQAVEYW